MFNFLKSKKNEEKTINLEESTLVEKGMILYKNKNYTESCRIFESIILKYPKNKKAQIHLVKIYSNQLKKYQKEKNQVKIEEYFNKIDKIRNISRKNF